MLFVMLRVTFGANNITTQKTVINSSCFSDLHSLCSEEHCWQVFRRCVQRKGKNKSIHSEPPTIVMQKSHELNITCNYDEAQNNVRYVR